MSVIASESEAIQLAVTNKDASNPLRFNNIHHLDCFALASQEPLLSARKDDCSSSSDQPGTDIDHERNDRGIEREGCDAMDQGYAAHFGGYG
jgi:hypothetical protein